MHMVKRVIAEVLYRNREKFLLPQEELATTNLGAATFLMAFSL